MTKVELSRFIEANYPISGRGGVRSPLYGVGINDARYTTNPMSKGKPITDPAYRAWASILKRAYDQKYHATHPTYSDVTVCKEWHSFSAFRVWWLDHYREDWHLDKDLLSPGNREYGPDACIYIPGWLNSFTTDSGSSRGEFPIGVYLPRKTGKYQSQCRNPITGKNHLLGMFTSPEEANEAWLNYKLSIADRLKKEMDRIDQRIYNNVRTIIIVKTLC